ncbi:hypothetical protein TKWG_14785 [Advenella kashmirensis WT001]|uniref:UPF0178 protein TKWG_14785 n=1 Tax=Advenella kashmirensis (strain DSM 17095 / LMG 22695 / WT001) TaxID=1036672 RepID=I3UDB5_ADVKW|nr:YaiI/YqxD family protein [Advenella kashmirensis]AFK63003.1 hypothetical protein TKWG_14785 [Advenella kashmirensis WT001]
MEIWVDADACPVVIKNILFRAAVRWQVKTTLVANQMLNVPPSVYIQSRQVPRGFDVADTYISQHARAGDLVITADIPLAAEVLEKGIQALNPRGELYSMETIRERLTMRDMMEALRSAGIETGGPRSFDQADTRAFAGQLDKLLARYAKA